MRGGQARKRTTDLAIAPTANVHKVPLLTENVGDFQIIKDLVDARSPIPTANEPLRPSPPADSP
jgi:toxin FitB